MESRPTRAQLVRRRAGVALALASVVGLVVTYFATTGTVSHTKATIHRVAAPRRGRADPARPKTNVYAATTAVRPEIANDVNRVYIPSGLADTVTVIDPATKQIVSRFSTGRGSTPQHVIPSFDLKTLWVLLNKSDHVVPIDAHTGAVGAPIAVNDPYNMYFTPDGTSAIVVAELHSRLDFRDPHSMAMQKSLDIPGCRGLNHADFSADLHSMLLTCEFAGTVVKVNLRARRVVGTLALSPPRGQQPVMTAMPDHSMASSMPQDVRLSPDGTKFYVADMLLGGIHVVDGVHLRETGFIPTGVGAHSVTPSHDGKLLYIANRGSTSTHGPPHGSGSVSVLDPATDQVVATWAIPGGGSPDMGNLTADGRELWLSGRFDSEVYAFDTATGTLTARIAVPRGPHGLTVWPLSGRYSLGHTGNMR
jgi:Uncharacterized conserved protein